MKYLVIALVFLSACAKKSLNKEPSAETSQLEKNLEEQGMVLMDAYQRFASGGKEREDGKQASTSFSIVVRKAEGVQLETVLIFGDEYEYEAFEHEGLYYIISKVYSDTNAANMDTQNDIPGEVVYTFKGELKSLYVEEFEVKEDLIGN